MNPPLITFTTDFGTDSPYVAEMKGTALAICPAARLIDISHAIPPQNVRVGGLALAQAAFRFPAGTIHVAVVDPGVGTERKIIAVRAEDHYFVAPDNGLLCEVFDSHRPDLIVEVDRSEYWLNEVSATFHGRDIMTPVAAHLAAGAPLEALGTQVKSWCELTRSQPHRTGNTITGEVMVIDSFGNVISNITRQQFSGVAIRRVVVNDYPIEVQVTTYGNATPGTLVFLYGSSGYLELAEVGGNAAKRLEISLGSEIRLELHD